MRSRLTGQVQRSSRARVNHVVKQTNHTLEIWMYHQQASLRQRGY